MKKVALLIVWLLLAYGSYALFLQPVQHGLAISNEADREFFIAAVSIDGKSTQLARPFRVPPRIRSFQYQGVLEAWGPRNAGQVEIQFLDQPSSHRRCRIARSVDQGKACDAIVLGIKSDSTIGCGCDSFP